jgi:predicted XRE-type DNA-binding protein
MNDVTRGTNNVLADLGFADASDRVLKVQLAMQIGDIVTARKLKQVEVAALFGVPQPNVSELLNFKLNRFSSERLMHFLTCLKCDVRITVVPTRKRVGTITLELA